MLKVLREKSWSLVMIVDRSDEDTAKLEWHQLVTDLHCC